MLVFELNLGNFGSFWIDFGLIFVLISGLIFGNFGSFWVDIWVDFSVFLV